MHVIGTAGHVDHGKSSLVRALTGMDPDRLEEEKSRQMTIDLGFAWYESPSVGAIGIIDVPGHKDFIENMLAGVGGIDAVLLVIAADEGVMPQTREHLLIIDLLQIRTGLVILTKIDMVDDPDWLDLVEMDIRTALKGSVLENSVILRVSSKTGEGLEAVREAIDELLKSSLLRQNNHQPRLPVDRVFSIKGFGTVVTGTLLDGSFQVEDAVEILPAQKSARIRGLQSHKKQELIALPGSRTAINLAGIDMAEIHRGDTVVHPGDYLPTRRVDATLELVPDAQVVLKHNDEVKIFVHTTECVARVRLMQKPALQPGESAWVQLEPEKPLVVAKNDRFIVRRISPAQTIGGGTVVDAHPARRYKLQDEQVIARLESKVSTSTQDALYSLILEEPFIPFSKMITKQETGTETAIDLINTLITNHQVIRFGGQKLEESVYVSVSYWEILTQKLMKLLDEYHEKFPLAMGIKKEELRRSLKLSEQSFNLSLQEWREKGRIKVEGDWVSLPTFSIRYSPAQLRRIQQLNEILAQKPFNPPSVKELLGMLGEDLYQSLLNRGSLIQLSAEVAVSDKEFETMREYVVAQCKNGILLTLGQFRDHFETSRKVSQAFLEHLDRIGITVRAGEGRRLKDQSDPTMR